ncbi:LysR family transcriptional regulator [Sphingomonas sp. HT-1]|uniref:LysR family transcriptional regulator n=1 Tax=unclassified Sphingomonas TaxID=196159 RepID=UPI0002E67E82|nr:MULTISPECIES: LysR substrate-binding domain-containing protein [unclassified Sphingomonas]KTF68884.1 LysR family transcriptional regulator [Sphingomonas sp. WG]
MNLRHIEIFHAVYVNGSVSAAARALNVSQPSVSKTLRHAESLLGFELFQRSNGRLLPTEDAHALFADVADIQERVRALREAGRNLRVGAGTTLRISALPSLGLGVLPDAVSRFLVRRPDVRFDLQTVHHDDLLRKLYERESDIAIASEPPRGVALTHSWLGEGELVVLYRERDMPDAPPRLELSQLVVRPVISLKGSGPIGKLLSEEIDRLGLVLNEVVVARTFYIAAALVRAGVGLAIVDNFTAAASMAPGLSMRPLRPSITFDVHAIHLLDRPPSMLVAEFLTMLSEEIERR